MSGTRAQHVFDGVANSPGVNASMEEFTDRGDG
jgi:hypothetical protein